MSGSRPTTTPPLPVADHDLASVRRGARASCAPGRGRTGRAGDLVVPAQLARCRRRAPRRVGVEVRARDGSSRSGTPGCRGTAPGWRCPSRRRRARVDRRRVPRAAAGVDLGVAPEVARFDGVERPAHLAGRGVERVDHAAVARRVDAADADRHRAHEHDAVEHRRLDVDAGRRRSRDVVRPRARVPVCRVDGDTPVEPCMPNTRPSATATPNGPMLNP